MIKIGSGSKLNSASVPPPSYYTSYFMAKFGKICGQTALGIRVSIHFCRTGKIRFQIFKSYPENQLKSQNGVSDYFFTKAFGVGGWGVLHLFGWLVGFGFLVLVRVSKMDLLNESFSTNISNWEKVYLN